MDKSRILSYLLNSLRRAKPVKSVRLLREDTVFVRMHLGEQIIVYVLDALPSVQQIVKMFDRNTYAGRHTLVILTANLLPVNGMPLSEDTTLRLLVNIFDGKLYAGRVHGRQVNIFPVHIEANRPVRHGTPVEIGDLSCDYVLVENGYIQGVRGIANFEKTYYHHNETRVRRPVSLHPLQEFFDVLGISCEADEETIKRAYRRKAHENHPDRDPSPDATARMQRINEAYQVIMEQFK